LNSLFKKFLLYNLIGLIFLGFLSTLIIFLSNNYQLNKRLSLIQNQALITYNFINSLNLQEGIIDELIPEELNANLELKNVSILILNNTKEVIFDSKGYDLETKSFLSEEYIQIESNNFNDQNNNKIENNSMKRQFIENPIFNDFFQKSFDGNVQKFSITLENSQLLLFSINPYDILEEKLFIVAYEDNNEIAVINNQIQLNIIMTVMAIILALMTFSFFLNFVILKPIKSLAKSAGSIEKNIRSKPKLDELEKRSDEIGDLSKTLNEMLGNLYEKINDTEKYSADLMHEIRNPLASIKMATEVIVDDTDIKQKKFLDMIQTDITRIENIITDYSAMIKDEAQLSKTESVIFDFKKLIIKIIADYKTLNEGKINFRFITSDDLNSELHLKGQQSFIEQSVKNIIDNAISFSKLGDTIIINLSSTANYLSLSISDEGPGIKEPIVEKIFERFYSLRESDKNFQSTHSGLGLNIAKQIIDVHDGYISANNIIENNVVKGARFIVNLPMSK
tara:strand:+ start:211 stop:1734 length:1524 start_codon:yes stop_codon:yes gene_type:complete